MDCCIPDVRRYCPTAACPKKHPRKCVSSVSPLPPLLTRNRSLLYCSARYIPRSPDEANIVHFETTTKTHPTFLDAAGASRNRSSSAWARKLRDHQGNLFACDSSA